MKSIPSPLAGKCILVVDDEEELRKAIAHEFRRRGCAIQEAGSGNEAIEAFMRVNFDIVISDVRMPNGTGVDLLERIRKVNPEMPLLFLVTGFSDLTPDEAEKRGANGMVTKPIDRKQLIALVEASLLQIKDVA